MAADETHKGGHRKGPHHAGLIRLFWRLSYFYLLVGGATALILFLFPQLLNWLPVGGIANYDVPSLFSQGTQVLQESAVADTKTWIRDAATLFLAMTATLILMVPVSWVFKAIHEGQVFDHSIDETAMVLPAVVAGVVTVAQQSLALAFSLAGVVAAVRFRRALTDTFDTLFIFVAIGVGLAAGVGALEIAVVITVFFTYATALISVFGDGLESKNLAEIERKKRRVKSKRSKKKSKAKKRAAQAGAAPESALLSTDASAAPTGPDSTATATNTPSERTAPRSVSTPKPGDEGA